MLADLAELGLSTLQLDVTNSDSLKACHEAVAKLTAGKLDILVNNACVLRLATAARWLTVIP